MVSDVCEEDRMERKEGASECMWCLWGVMIDAPYRRFFCGLLRTFRWKSVRSCVLLKFLRKGGGGDGKAG